MSHPDQPSMTEAGVQRLCVVVRGAVQGVGFRPFVYRLATELGLAGWVMNSADGVFLEVEGPESQLREFRRRLSVEKPAIAFIQSMEATFRDAAGYRQFEIRESGGGPKTALILPDIATCPDCRREICDPADRRYRYSFTNCTNCGPRFSIIESLPYDRARTSMKHFSMCALCAREYGDPANRRFHAQPNACPVCGPQLQLWTPEGETVAEKDQALRAAAEAIRRGRVVAVKGLGGFHLLVDARHENAVGELRRRKRREEKPLAVMYPSLPAILEDCHASEIELALLRSPESPIVLLRRKPGAAIARTVAPGNPYLGVMTAYTPLHHLLMLELDTPVVATSGNLSEEPICTDGREALRRLHGLADLFLVHDRPILRHVDDSVVREMAGRELVLRRARGFAPLPVLLDRELPPLLAVGPQQKNTIALSVGRQAFLSQHIGDLETAESLRAFEEVQAAFLHLYAAQPQSFACDLHPGYLSTEAARRSGKPVSAVQHHQAHVLACMAENHLTAPVLGVAWDGSGFGPDNTVWGGEFLHLTGRDCVRIAHLRTFCLPGGEQAIRQPKRTALGVLYEIFGDQAFTLDTAAHRACSSEELRVLRAMLPRGVNSPRTSSAGRLFDAVAALAGVRQVCGFEGQAAMELEFAAGDHELEQAYPFSLAEREGMLIVDWEPMIRTILERPAPAQTVAAAFHNTLAEVIVGVARRVGEPRVVLSGGCFQNRRLTEAVIHHLQTAGFKAYWHQRIPPNDGGIALGQLMGAAAEQVIADVSGHTRKNHYH